MIDDQQSPRRIDKAQLSGTKLVADENPLAGLHLLGPCNLGAGYVNFTALTTRQFARGIGQIVHAHARFANKL